MRKNKLLLYLRVLIVGLFGLNNLRRATATKKGRAKTIAMGCLIVFCLLAAAGYVAMTVYGYAILGLTAYIPALMFLVTNLILFFITFYKTNGFLFANGDQELVSALPIKASTVLAARFLGMYILNLLGSCIVMVPALIVYGIFTEPSFAFYLFFVITLFFLPLLPMVIASALGALVTLLSSRFRRSNIVSIVLTLILITVIVVAPLFFVNDFSAPAPKQTNDIAALAPFLTQVGVIMESIGNYYLPLAWYSDALSNHSPVGFLLFIAVSALVFYLFIKIVAHYYSRINTALTTQRARGNYELREVKTSSIFSALLRRDIKRYFASSLYVVNTAVGPILLIVFALACLFIPKSVFANIPLNVTALIPMLMAFIVGISVTTAVTISIEGKQVWILQSLPAPRAAIYNSKLAINYLVMLPGVYIGAIIFLIALDFAALDAILLFLMPTAYVAVISEVGLGFNLRHPKYDWKQEAAVVKQGFPLLATMLFDFGFSVVAFGAIVLLDLFHILSASITTLLITVILFAILPLLHRKNQRIRL